jgi:hypothetical protein
MQQGYVNQSILLITMPTQININSITCLPVSTNLISSSCTVVSNIIKVLLVYNNLATPTLVSFKLQSYINYPTL